MRFLLPAALGLLLVLPAAGAETEATPRAIVENNRIDAGRVVRGQSAEGVFRVRNLGAAPLRILSVKPG